MCQIEYVDFAERYRIVESHDRRFDGQFIMAVLTTGIYCRPSCPARTPKPANVQFFTTSAAAHRAGFRACRRCLPEATPGSPEWSLRQDTAGRAMRLIAEGVVERNGVAGLAGRLGYSQRQLNRLLTDELGAGPIALARAQRAQNARQLIVSTTMPMADIAFAAGFSSIRQFNDTIAEVYGLTPTRMRYLARTRGRVECEQSGVIHVLLAHRAPLDVYGLLDWFGARAISGMETVTPTAYTRTLHTSSGAALVEITYRASELSARLWLDKLADLPAVLAAVRRLFDVNADPQAVDAVLRTDQRLAAQVRAIPGIRIPGAVNATEILARAVLGQQVTVASARQQLERLVAELGVPLSETVAGQTEYRLFPTAATIAEHAPEIIRGPRRRTETLQRVCAALADGSLDVDVSTPRTELTRRLIAIHGIGPWTADYVALRFLGHPDVLVSKDVAIRRGARELGFSDTTLSDATQRLSPWRSYLSMHLWRASAGRSTGRSTGPSPGTATGTEATRLKEKAS